MKFITSPWSKEFDEFIFSIKESAWIVAPYITADPLNKLADHFTCHNPPKFTILTALYSRSMANGSIDVAAIKQFCDRFPKTELINIKKLHAKIYVADAHTAIITSGNLTYGSLFGNKEFGIRIGEKSDVEQVLATLNGFKKQFGYTITRQDLQNFCEDLPNIEEALRSQTNEEAEKLLQELQKKIDQSGTHYASVSAIFQDAILELLQHGELPLKTIYEKMEIMHPELCRDDHVYWYKKGGETPGWQGRIRSAGTRLVGKGKIERFKSPHNQNLAIWRLTNQ